MHEYILVPIVPFKPASPGINKLTPSLGSQGRLTLNTPKSLNKGEK